MQKLDLEQSSRLELLSYQIALLTIVNNCNLEITRVKAKLEKLTKEDKDE
jgi:hypothetical protein